MTDLLIVGLESWIIQDGNYEDFSRGDRTEFALEFYAPQGFDVAASAGKTSLISSGAATYKCSGQVLYAGDRWWVIDAGLLMFSKGNPPFYIQQGAWINGNIYVGIDPFFYFETLCRDCEGPALIYEWEIEKIEIQTAPLIYDGPKRRIRDPERLGWREIAKTNAWEDDEGSAEYLLHCKRLSMSPRRMLNRPRS